MSSIPSIRMGFKGAVGSQPLQTKGPEKVRDFGIFRRARLRGDFTSSVYISHDMYTDKITTTVPCSKRRRIDDITFRIDPLTYGVSTLISCATTPM